MNLANGLKKCVFFRDDDVAELNAKLIKLIDVFVSYGVPLHLAVIPQKLTRECRDFLKEKIKVCRGLLEIGQHGFVHKDCSGLTDNFGKYEFGEHRSSEQQKEDILQGKELLEKYFEQKINIFTPPWHAFDRNTLEILEEMKFLGISSGRKKNALIDQSGLKDFSIDVDFNKRNSGGRWFTEDSAEIIRKVAAADGLKMGILLHHNAFNEPDDFLKLEKLLGFLKKNKIIECVLLSASLKSEMTACRVRPDVLAYYLTYQFVPKPMTLIENSVNPFLEGFDFNCFRIIEQLEQREESISACLYANLTEAVSKQLPDKEAPVGLLLSGGIDSAAILHILRDLTDRKIYTVTAAYDKDAEHLYCAEKLADAYRTVHQSLIISPDRLRQIDELYQNDIPQPIGDTGFLPTYFMMKEFKEKTRHVFAGDGADCLFCGLKIHLQNLTQTRKDVLYEHYRFGEILLSNEELKIAFGKKAQDINLAEPLKNVADRITIDDSVKRQVLIDLNFLVRNRVDYVYYAAKVGGVDVLLPYLDQKFVDFSLKIPSAYLFAKDHQQKYILRQAFQNKLPEWVLNRKKEGFTPPFKLWYYKNKEFVIRNLLRTKRIGIPNEYIKYLILNIKNDVDYDFGMKIWLLLNLSSWMTAI